MQLDKYKQAVLDVYLTTNKNIVVSASPGTGKTTLIKVLASHTAPTKRALYAAFNKSIVEDVKGGVPDFIDVSTIHSKSYGILRNNVKMRAKVNESKFFQLAHSVLNLKWIKLSEEEEKKTKPHLRSRKLESKKHAYVYTVCELTNLIRLNLTELDAKSISALAERYGVDAGSKEVNDAIQLLTIASNLSLTADNASIDFTDMLYLTYKLVGAESYPKYDVIFVDEAQDVNPLQREIILRMLKPKGRLIVVGDPKQSIYSFQGSNLDSFNYFATMPKTVELPLSMTYRLPKAIVELANTIFEGLETANEQQGSVDTNGSLIDAVSGDFVLCRNNLPLVEALISLLENGKKATIYGQELGERILSYSTSVDNVGQLYTMLARKEEELRSKGVSNPKTHKGYVSIKEIVDIIAILEKTFGGMNKLNERVSELFTRDKTDGINLMTIHKSKGLEANRIYFLDKHLIPSKFAKTELDMYQEKCLEYVAITRAKNELIFCKSEK